MMSCDLRYNERKVRCNGRGPLLSGIVGGGIGVTNRGGTRTWSTHKLFRLGSCRHSIFPIIGTTPFCPFGSESLEFYLKNCHRIDVHLSRT